MINSDFWINAVDLIDEISTPARDSSVFSTEELLRSFIETYMDNCDPAVHFHEYVFLRLVKAVVSADNTLVDDPLIAGV